VKILLAMTALVGLTGAGAPTDLDASAIMNGGGMVALAWILWRGQHRLEEHMVAIRIKLGAGDPRKRTP
jgi:hypothetical protein